MPRSPRMALRPLLAVLLGGTALLAAPGLGAAAADGAPVRAAPDPQTRAVAEAVATHLADQPTKADRGRLQLLQQLIADRGRGRADLGQRAVELVTRRSAAHLGLERNLALAAGHRAPERSQELLKEAQAVFDPVFEVSIGFNRKDTYTRTKAGLVRPKTFYATGNDPNGSRRFNVKNYWDLPNSDSPQVVALEYYRNPDPDTGVVTAETIKLLDAEVAAGNMTSDERNAIINSGATGPMSLGTSTTPVQDTITASPGRSATKGHPEQKITYTLGVTQQLPWGGTLTLTDTTIQQKVWYRTDHYWESGQFTSNLSGVLDMPLPYTKGFGSDNPNGIAIRKAEIARGRADWELKALLNGTLRDVDLAYFELARRLEALETTVANRGLAGQLQGQVKRLFDAGEATRVQMAVAEGEAAKADLRVEQALQSYLNASIQLGGLVGDPGATKGETIFLPYGHANEVRQVRTFDAKAAMATARENRPDFFLSKADLESAQADLALARNQALPDVRAGMAFGLNENGSVYGYQHPVQSHWRLMEPDSSSHTYSLAYSYPLLNRGPDARVDRTQLGVNDRELGVRDTETQVRRELTERLAALQSARSRAGQAGREAATLRRTYDSLVRLRDIGQVSEDQLINTSRRLLSAELARIDAMTEGKQAETSLLAAQGVIARELPNQTTHSALDKRRVEALTGSEGLRYFGKGPRLPERDAPKR